VDGGTPAPARAPTLGPFAKAFLLLMLLGIVLRTIRRQAARND
jgi:hypothetical protein